MAVSVFVTGGCKVFVLGARLCSEFYDSLHPFGASLIDSLASYCNTSYYFGVGVGRYGLNSEYWMLDCLLSSLR